MYKSTLIIVLSFLYIALFPSISYAGSDTKNLKSIKMSKINYTVEKTIKNTDDGKVFLYDCGVYLLKENNDIVKLASRKDTCFEDMLLMGNYSIFRDSKKIYIINLDNDRKNRLIKLNKRANYIQLVDTKDGNFAVAYIQDNFSTNLKKDRLVVMKYNLRGRRLWKRSFTINRSGILDLKGVVDDGKGGIVATGTMASKIGDTLGFVYIFNRRGGVRKKWIVGKSYYNNIYKIEKSKNRVYVLGLYSFGTGVERVYNVIHILNLKSHRMKMVKLLHGEKSIPDINHMKIDVLGNIHIVGQMNKKCNGRDCQILIYIKLDDSLRVIDHRYKIFGLSNNIYINTINSIVTDNKGSASIYVDLYNRDSNIELKNKHAVLHCE